MRPVPAQRPGEPGSISGVCPGCRRHSWPHVPLPSHPCAGLSFDLTSCSVECQANLELEAFPFTEENAGPEWAGHWPKVTQQDHPPVSDFLVFSFFPSTWGVWTGLCLTAAA